MDIVFLFHVSQQEIVPTIVPHVLRIVLGLLAPSFTHIISSRSAQWGEGILRVARVPDASCATQFVVHMHEQFGEQSIRRRAYPQFVVRSVVYHVRIHRALIWQACP